MNSLIYGDTGGSEMYTLSLTSQFVPVRYAELILYGKCWKEYAVSASAPPKCGKEYAVSASAPPKCGKEYAVSASAPPKIPDFDANIFDILL